MELLTIGAFARAARLSPKALRLYDELGLLRPAQVDPYSGYRYYEPAQLELARLVAWLRRLGMPLAEIRVVAGLAPAEAAGAVAAYWAGVEADTGARREFAAFLIGHLSGKVTAMQESAQALAIRYAARCETGPVRESNEDRVYAGERLLAVADGFGGSAASAAAIEALSQFDGDIPAGNLLNAMQDAIGRAGDAVRGAVGTQDQAAQAGTTLTAMLLCGSQLALVHIGDSRAYLLRAGELFQITHDHSLVQSMVDEGRITADEAASHPQRALLLRALDGRPGSGPDAGLHEVLAGDRYLLCSDGLSAVVAPTAIADVLSAVPDTDEAATRLVGLALEAGGPDNVSCVIGDIVRG